MTQEVTNTPSTSGSSKFFGMSPLPYEEKLKIIEEDYTPKIHKIGVPTAAIHAVIMFLPALFLLVFYHVWPGWGIIMNAVVPIWAALGVIYFLEPLQYYLALGTAGTYVTFISGNGSNIRLPTAVATTEAMGVEPGSPEAEIVSGISIMTSQWLVVILMLIAALGITAIINVLPPAITKAFDFLIPALFGGMLINIGLHEWRYLIVSLVLGLALNLLGVNANLITFIMVFFMIGLSVIFYKKGIWIPKEEKRSAAVDDD
ncbi:MAG: hypothetical protein LLG42_00120 [Chloroflexi bacterium]|nr:hypothetical protein [Chloroflexota bacterium]